MNLFTGLLKNAVVLSIFDINPWVLGILGVIALAIGIVLFTVRCKITYMDPEGDYVIHSEKHQLLKKVQLHGACKAGKKLVGWSITSDGLNPVEKTSMVLIHNEVLYAVWEDVDMASAVSVEFNYMDADEDVAVRKDVFVLNTKLPEVQDNGLEIEGWSFTPEEAPVLTKDDVKAVFVINLYPIFEESPISNADVPTNDKAIVDVLFTDGVTNKDIYKESHYLKLNLPEEYEQFDNFLGWGFATDGEIILDKSKAESVFTIQLFSKPVDAPVTIEAPKAEPVVEEVIEEPVVEEVVEEAPIEEVIEEPVVEKTAEEAIKEVAEIVEEPFAKEEVVEEAPVEEVVEEAPVEEVVEEAPVEEVVEEAPVEEVVEEAPVEEVVEEAPVEEVVEEAPVEEVIEEAPVVEEQAQEPVAEPVQEENNPVIVPTYFDNEGNKIDINYSRSITANIIQSDDTVKSYYGELKNHILSYKGVKSRISWKFDSYNRGRDQLFKIKFRGKTICLYCALNPEEFDKSKYHHEAINAKIFADVPMLVKIKSGLGLRKAKELVDIEMAKFDIAKNEKAKEVDYQAMYPYEENEPLIEKGLIKVLVSDENLIKKSTKPVEEVVEEPVVEVVEEPVVEAVEEPVVEEVIEEPVVEVVEEPVVEEVIEEPVVEVVEEPVVEVVEEPVVEVVEEPVVEEVIEEPAVEAVEEPVAEEPAYEEHVVIVEEVTAEDADQLAEEKHIDIHTEEGVEFISSKDTKKAIVNIDTLSDSFNPHEVADLASMKAKGLIDKKSKSVKVLARGSINKPLIVKAGEFSRTAVEMILLTGGNAVHVTYKVK